MQTQTPSMPPSSLDLKEGFPLLNASPALSYLDSAATTQRPASVIEAQARFYRDVNANPLRGLYDLSIRATEAVDAARAHVARFVGAQDPREVVFCRNATEALNIAARCFAPVVLNPGDEICVTVMEHHSNLVPWQQACRQAGARLVVLHPDISGVISDQASREAVGPRTKILAMAHVSNVLGTIAPVRALADEVHAQGGYLVLDAAQSAGHLPIDVTQLDVDFLAFSAHKAYGPMGVGVLWGRLDLLEASEPLLTGGEMIRSVTEQDAIWACIPEKFEAGTQDAAGIMGLDAALNFIESIGFNAIRQHESALLAYADARLRQIEGVRVLGPTDPSLRSGVISFNLEGIHPHDVAALLNEDQVAIRAGHHCAQPLFSWLEEPGSCRASFGVYNTFKDVDALVAGLIHVQEAFGVSG
ncbi:MAG: SufS family cysteine desulfurase [Eggerthellales bacterium]|nr:SufS family cysteine desulfurase [Eggerthellales bacterium]